MNERDLVEGAKEGDVEARDELFEASYESLERHLSLKAARSSPLARQLLDDVAQDTYVAGLGGLGRFRREASFKTYLKAIADRLMSGTLNRELRLVRGVGGDADPVADVRDPRPDPVENLIGKERARLVTRAIEELSADQREAVTLLMSGERFYAVVYAIAERQRVTRYRAEQRLARALTTLADRLPDDL